MYKKKYNAASMSPDQILNIGYVLIFISFMYFNLLVLAIMALVTLIIKALTFYCTTWTVNEDCLIEKTGILNINIEEILLYRVKDVKIYQPLLYRFVGLSKLTVITSDYSRPSIVLYGIKEGDKWMGIIRELVANSRKIQGVKEIDIR